MVRLEETVDATTNISSSNYQRLCMDAIATTNDNITVQLDKEQLHEIIDSPLRNHELIKAK